MATKKKGKKKAAAKKTAAQRLPIRQGDVMLRPVSDSDMPKLGGVLAKKLCVLVHGTATGHSHRVNHANAQLRAGPDERRFLVLGADAMLEHEEHTHIPLAAGTWEVIRQREYDENNDSRVVAD